MRSGSKPTSGISRKMPSYRLSGKAEEDLFEIAIFGIEVLGRQDSGRAFGVL